MDLSFDDSNIAYLHRIFLSPAVFLNTCLTKRNNCGYHARPSELRFFHLMNTKVIDMNLRLIHVLLTVFFFATNGYSQTVLAPGEQPQITVDDKGLIRLVFGEKDKILYTTSVDNGKTFTKPVVIGEVVKMHLGMTRGPQLASSKDYSIVTAIDQPGNIHTFRLTHKTGKWEKVANVNDSKDSAPEGLMSIAADTDNNFYAVWLDLREDRKNNIAFATMNSGSRWTKNKFAYKSAEDHVCECCKPSIAVRGNNVSIMFRNWLKGARDLYLVSSSDKGQTFSASQKLGNGTWPLKGCPMDGGGLVIDARNEIHTAWQRDGQIYYVKPGEQEQKIGEGRHVGFSGNIITWESGSELVMKTVGGETQKIGDGTALKLFQLADKSILAVWEKDDQIVYKKIG